MYTPTPTSNLHTAGPLLRLVALAPRARWDVGRGACYELKALRHVGRQGLTQVLVQDLQQQHV